MRGWRGSPVGVRVYSLALGRELEVPERPERIVSLAPAVTETLFRIGAGDRVVGVSVFCSKPPEACTRPRVGSYYKVDYKRLDPLEPDLILATTGAQQGVVRELEERGYRVYPIPLPTSIYGVLDNIITTGIVVGELAGARRLAAELASRLPRLRGALEGVRVYYEIDLGGPVSAGAHSYIVDALEYLGAETVFSRDRVPWVINPDPERVKSFDPDLIVYEKKPYSRDTPETVRRKLEERGLGGLRALREGRLIVLPPDSLAHYGPSLFDALEDLAAEARRLLGGGGA
jgi:iron complex transport system substrate-binding protein